MSRVLLIGENPNGPTGNGLMMLGIVNQIDLSLHGVTIFCPCSDFAPDLSTTSEVAIVPSDDVKRQDIWGARKLLTLLDTNELDFVVMVGIDIWRYIDIIQHIKQIQVRKKFKLIHIFPYDLQYLDKEFVQYANLIDIPCVYSQYGFLKLKDSVPNLRYFKPPMPHKELFFPYDDAKRQEARGQLFPTISPDTFVFGFIGPNQMRKDPQKLVRAFAILKETVLYQKKVVLYMHTNFKNGVYNLSKYAVSEGLTSGDLLIKPEDSYSPFERMPDIFNALDCFVNCSMQEGLSWTTIQAMLCGTPVIASNSTAHKELLGEYGTLVPCDSPTYLPIKTVDGQRWIDAMSCKVEDMASEMHHVYSAGKEMRIKCSKFNPTIRDWVDTPSDIAKLLKISAPVAARPLIPQILFMQHSSAGDILMTTRCLKRIREKHGGLPLVYMTQSKFFGILHQNPDIQEVLDWNPELRKQYQFVYNPHGEHILRGGFNNLDVKLADMYPYFCKVEPGDFFIDCVKPEHLISGIRDKQFEDFLEEHKNSLIISAIEGSIIKDYIVVHTTGGEPQYRTYAHMGLVTKGLQLPVVQIGSNTDLYCPGAIDLRGILAFTETAWVVKHAKAAIVIDSFPSHLAGALGTPCIVLYGPAPARVVGPIHTSVPDNLWFDMEPNKLDVCPDMTNCHGRSKTCQSPCINSINPMEVKKNLVKILEQVM